MISATLAVSPLCFRIREIRPESGEGNSTVAFSLSRLTTGSSLATSSPSFFSQSPISTSTIDSPTCGIFSSMDIDCSPSPRPSPLWRGRITAAPGSDRYEIPSLLILALSLGRRSAVLSCISKRAVKQVFLFLSVAAMGTGGGTSGGGPRDPGKRKAIQQLVAKLNAKPWPCSHVDRFFLNPENGRAGPKTGQR